MTTGTTIRATISRSAEGYVGGTWIVGGGTAYDVINPATEDVIATVQRCTVEQADRAVAAAADAFRMGPWHRMRPGERAELLFRLADLIERDAEALVDLVVEEIATPIAVARGAQVPYAVGNFRWFASAAAALEDGPGHWAPPTTPQTGTATRLVREPVGVVAALAAYNFPYNLAAWKVGAALAAGCTAVLLCSPKTVLSTTALARLFDEAGFPPGVFNFVYGGPEVAEHLCAHQDVDMITFTGSAAIGSRVSQLAAPTLKRVVLELGGKSADLVLPGTDLATVTPGCVAGWTGNAGQSCDITSRTLVHRSEFDRYVEQVVSVVESIGCGDPRDPDTVVGPLISAEHVANVAGYVDRAVAAGATVATGGRRPPGFERGFYYAPTVVVGVDNTSEIAREELFAPVNVVIPYDEVDEAVALANDTVYGLNAGVWGPPEQAAEIAMHIRSGTVKLNGGGAMLPDHPWGGYKRSGNGREGGTLGLAEFLETKHVMWPLS